MGEREGLLLTATKVGATRSARKRERREGGGVGRGTTWTQPAARDNHLRGVAGEDRGRLSFICLFVLFFAFFCYGFVCFLFIDGNFIGARLLSLLAFGRFGIGLKCFQVLR